MSPSAGHGDEMVRLMSCIQRVSCAQKRQVRREAADVANQVIRQERRAVAQQQLMDVQPMTTLSDPFQTLHQSPGHSIGTSRNRSARLHSPAARKCCRAVVFFPHVRVPSRHHPSVSPRVTRVCPSFGHPRPFTTTGRCFTTEFH